MWTHGKNNQDKPRTTTPSFSACEASLCCILSCILVCFGRAAEHGKHRAKHEQPGPLQGFFVLYLHVISTELALAAFFRLPVFHSDKGGFL